MSAVEPEGDLSPEITLEQLGTNSMTLAELAVLAEHLRRLAGFVDELRFLRGVEESRNWRERIPNRPTIGYYLRLRADRAESCGSSAEPPPAPAASRGRSEAPAR